jgi:hypothetical protein
MERSNHEATAMQQHVAGTKEKWLETLSQPKPTARKCREDSK